MTETVTFELSAELATRARAVAAVTNRRFEDVVAEWVGRGAAEPDLERTPDDELLKFCDSELPSPIQQELSDLLARNRESRIDTAARNRLDELMAAYRQALVVKAKAWQLAVARGLRRPLSDSAA